MSVVAVRITGEPHDCCMVTGGAPRPTAQQVVQADCWLLRKRILQMKGIPDRNESVEGNGGGGSGPRTSFYLSVTRTPRVEKLTRRL